MLTIISSILNNTWFGTGVGSDYDRAAAAAAAESAERHRADYLMLRDEGRAGEPDPDEFNGSGVAALYRMCRSEREAREAREAEEKRRKQAEEHAKRVEQEFCAVQKFITKCAESGECRFAKGALQKCDSAYREDVENRLTALGFFLCEEEDNVYWDKATRREMGNGRIRNTPTLAAPEAPSAPPMADAALVHY